MRSPALVAGKRVPADPHRQHASSIAGIESHSVTELSLPLLLAVWQVRAVQPATGCFLTSPLQRTVAAETPTNCRSQCLLPCRALRHPQLGFSAAMPVEVRLTSLHSIEMPTNRGSPEVPAPHRDTAAAMSAASQRARSQPQPGCHADQGGNHQSTPQAATSTGRCGAYATPSATTRASGAASFTIPTAAARSSTWHWQIADSDRASDTH